MNEDDMEKFKSRYFKLKSAEQDKDTLIEDLLDCLDHVNKDLSREQMDRAREIAFNRDGQTRELGLQRQIRDLQNRMDRDAFILFLIDGDGLLFEDSFMANGEAGGKEAATLLWNTIHEHVDERFPDLQENYRIVVKVYANLRGLGSACSRAGIISAPSVMEDFARGFTGSNSLFDYIDVGFGKDRADDKISEALKLHIHDPHCRHKFVGCSHDNGYARLLENINDSKAMDTISLIEGVPFERELLQLKNQYYTTKFPGLFRSEKINVFSLPSRAPMPSNGTATMTPTNGMAPTMSSPFGTYQQPLLPEQYTAISQKRDSSSAFGSIQPVAASWAAAARAPPVASPSPPPPPQPIIDSKPTVPRNRYGQRVDPMITYDPMEIKRIKAIKMCNVHFLRNDCPYDPCHHDHHYNPTAKELELLRYVSRTTPCRNGLDCDDPKCLYGHRCPNDVEGQRRCRFGDNCHFPSELHGIDRNVVNTVTIGAR